MRCKDNEQGTKMILQKNYQPGLFAPSEPKTSFSNTKTRKDSAP